MYQGSKTKMTTKFPKIFKSNNGTETFLVIIYPHRQEMYKLVSRYNNTIAKTQNSEYNPFTEIEMYEGNNETEIKTEVI